MKGIESLLELMARLRDPQTGCPWDLQQNFQTIAPYTIEEAYEVADAIERNALDELQGELGDLLFHIVFHSQLAREAGLFDFADVVEAIVEKMTRRHPHVFANAQISDSQQQTEAWNAIKATERQSRGQASLLEDIPLSLPALKRAEKIHKRVANAGFDDLEAEVIIGRLHRALDALITGINTSAGIETQEVELGNLLFSCTNLARQLKLDPEQVLKATNSRFTHHFRSMEDDLRTGGRTLQQLDRDEMHQAWQQVMENMSSS